jgi:hypothetical protein
MRYRLHIRRAELLAAALPFSDGVMKLLNQQKHGTKRLDLKLEKTAEFIAELRQYAPRAAMDGPDFALLERAGV